MGVSRANVGLVSRWGQILRFCLTDGVPKRSFVVALIVGAVLNLINQGDAILAGADVDVTKALLTFAVPYCVATYGAVSFRLRTVRRRDEEVPPRDAGEGC
jgi:hypothetical protein